MIGNSKNNRENYPRKCFQTQEKETRVKFNPGLGANRPSNWAQKGTKSEEKQLFSQARFDYDLGVLYSGFIFPASRLSQWLNNLEEEKF